MEQELLSFTPSGMQFAWDSTSVSAFEKCPRYYQLRHIEGWQPLRKSEDLRFGGHYATALEKFHKLLALGNSREDALAEVIALTLRDTWDREGEAPGPWQSLHNTKTRETLLRSIVWYVDHFADDPTQVVQLASGVPAVEYSFSVNLSGDYIYCGHIDRLVEYAGGKYVMDQKTTGSTITPYYFDQFVPDVQMGGYTWAGKIIFDMPVSGVIIDAAQIAVGFTRFARGFIQYPEPLLNEWFENTINTIEEAEAAHTSGHYPMRRSSCGNYGGCAFRKVCSRHPTHRNQILQSEFRREPRWDPLKRR